MILTLKDLVIHKVVGERVVRSRDGKTIQVHSVWDAGHPRGVGGEVEVEGKGGSIVVVGCRRSRFGCPGSRERRQDRVLGSDKEMQ